MTCTLLLALALAHAPHWNGPTTAPATPEPRPGADLTERHPTLGLVVSRPDHYEARPCPPGATGMLLVYAPSDAPSDRRAPATLSVFRIPLGGAPEVALERWALDTFRPRRLEAERSVLERFGRKPFRFGGETVDENGDARALFVHGWANETDIVVVVGEGETGRARVDRRAWERFADTMRFEEVRDDVRSRTKWQRYYGQRRFSQPEKRVELRMQLVAGWEVRDTENYLILFHGAADAPLLETVAVQLEGLRRRFEKDFPPDGAVDGLPIVRICRDRGEYLTYGGEGWTAGYFNPNAGELVLYDARADREAPLDENHPTLATLHHEACHQYLHATAGALPPHTWFDEGCAEFYAGAKFDAGVLRGVESLEGREAWLRAELGRRTGPPLEELLAMDQKAFYADANLHYAMAWSFVYFLRTSDDPLQRRILERYFAALKGAWRGEVEKLGRRGVTQANLDSARAAARSAALAAAFAEVDVEALERRWRGR